MIPSTAKAFDQIIVQAVASPYSAAALGMGVSPKIIEALDNSIREELQRFSHELFLGVLVSCFVVGIGVLMEGPEILHELWPRLFIWITRSSHERLEKFELWAKKVAFVGWFLIGLGVIGEGAFEALQNRAEGQLQTFETILLGDTQKTAGEAKVHAASLDLEAAKLQKEAEQLRTDAEDEHMKRVLLEAQLQQRHLSRKQSDDLIKALKDSPTGGIAVVGVMPLDGEAKIYAQDFHDVLLQAGPKWNRDERWRGVTLVDNFELPGLPFDPWGITIRCRSDATCEAGHELALAFKKAGFEEPPVVDVPSKYDCVVLLIGRQPTVDFRKPVKPKATKGSKPSAKP